MTQDSEGLPTTTPEAAAEQMLLYAQELREIYRKERQARLELEERNTQLQREVEERLRAEQAVVQLARQNQLILDSAGEGIFGLNSEGLATFINPAGAHSVGYPIEELAGANLHDYLHHTKADGTPFPQEECPIHASFTDGEAHRTASDVFWRKDGSSFPVEYISTPILGEDGKVLGAVVSFQDITERLAVDRMKDEFVSMVSHELRTPLTSIKGYVDLILEGEVGDISGIQHEFLDIVKSNTERLVVLINDLLDISRLESGRMQLTFIDLDLGELIRTVHRQMGLLGNNKGIETVLEIPSEPLIVRADQDRVIQALANLISNAYKYSPSGTTVEARLSAAGSQALVEVIDQGFGMSVEDQEQLFTKFFRSRDKRAQEVGGTGLGLAITKSIIELQGGDMSVQSILGQGSNFSFTLPLTEVSPS